MSPRTKNTPEDWKRTRFCAHTHKKKQGHAYSLLLCCVIGTRRSIDFARSIVTFWLARGGFVGPIRERPTSRSLFFRSEFFDARCTAIFPSALRSIQNALEAKKTPNKLSTRARENTQKTHREKKKKKKKKKKKRNNDAPVYCSTSDFTHPSNPSSNVSKNAAPSTVSRLADADDANAATVVAHAIVFFKPQYVLLFLPPPMMMMMMICHVRVRFYIERESFEEILIGL